MKKKAIPTTYKGIRFKSRLEANCALLLDSLGWDWKYEPESFLLSDGTHYCPDFKATAGKEVVWVECRGYKTKKGNRQLDGFLPLAEKRKEHYLVLSPEGCFYDGKPAYVIKRRGKWVVNTEPGGGEISLKRSDILIAGIPFVDFLSAYR